MGGSEELRVVVAGYYPPPFGGESVHLLHLASRLRTDGVLKGVVNLRRGAPPSPDYVAGAGPWRLWTALVRLLGPGTLLHLHTNGHSWKSWTMILCAAAALRLRRSPGVLTLHSGLSPGFVARAGAVSSRVLRAALAPFDRVVCVNAEVRRTMARLGIPDERLAVVPAFLGAGPVTTGDDADEEVLPGASPLLSAVAGPGPEYGLPVLIEAVDRLRARYPRVGCVVVGTTGDDGPAGLARARHLAGHVRFLGPLPHARCLALVARSHLFMRPSLADGDAVSVREALALGVPVVASDSAPRPAGVHLFRSGDSADLERRIAALLRHGPGPQAQAPGPDLTEPILALYRAAAGRGAPPASRRPGRSIAAAVRALGRELVGFRVGYPLEIVPDAERPDSLRYHLHSDRLFLDGLELDPRGVPRKRYRLLGLQYNPLFVAWWGLHHLERAAREGPAGPLDVFRAQLDWLRDHAVTRHDGAVVWPCRFDWQEGRARLRAPWISAMYQGVVISALVRGYRLTGDPRLLELALAGSRVFEIDVEAGGVRSREPGYVLYEEYPAFPLPRILDGFLLSLLGLYDLHAQTGDGAVGRLFEEGMDGLVRHLGRWDYRGKWSWYGSHGYLCPPHYHALNRALLAILSRITGEETLARTARAWGPDRLSPLDRAEVFLVFTITKNRARLSLPNEKGG